MVTIRKRRLGNKDYFYLEHTIKIGKKVKKKEKYLGQEIPNNIEEIKQDFFHTIFRERWFKPLGSIKSNFTKDCKAMPKSAREKYIENFMIKFTYDTNRIEGSTLSLKETANLLEKGIAPKKPLEDVKETEAHKKVFYEMIEYNKDLNLNIVLYWHRLLFKDTKLDLAGKIRKHSVAVAGSKTEFPFPAELEVLLRDFFRWYHKNKNKLNPVELAALVHLKFVSIHPFSDGNGRISRLIMNFVLHKAKSPMLNIHYSNRDSYYTALERSQINKKDHIFIQYLIKRYIKEYKKYL
ncbi:Fic family protein [Candidatus Woesearchaeota archaeon]|nr:Fic family protein [Candidatus Woesearchaeota archaeon]